MMYANQSALTGVGTGAAFTLVPSRNIWAVSLQTQVSGTATYDIEATIDNVNWIKVTTGITTSVTSHITTPCQGLRVVITSGTGTVTSTLLEIR